MKYSYLIQLIYKHWYGPKNFYQILTSKIQYNYEQTIFVLISSRYSNY